MSAEDRIVCKNFLLDPTTNPRTGARLIKNKGPYNNYFKLCQQFGLVENQSISPTIDKLTKKSLSSLKNSNNDINIDKIFTSLPDTDLTILLHTNSLEDIVNIYNTSKYFRTLLNKPSSWNIIQHYFKLFQLKNVQELAILNQELALTKVKHKNYRKNKIYNFGFGDRVVITSKPESYRVVNVKSPNLTLQQVDMFGNTLSNPPILCKLQGNKASGIPWAWYYKDEKMFEIKFGINNDTGHRVKSIDSPYLKYKTLLFDSQHGKPVELDISYSAINIRHGNDNLKKLAKIPDLINKCNTTVKHIGYETRQIVANFRPEINIMVEAINHNKVTQRGGLALPSLSNIYYIDAMQDDKVSLKILPEISPDYGYEEIPDTITAIKKNNYWYEEKSGESIDLGFGSGYVHNYYMGKLNYFQKLLLFL
jgi:hypothetical protein